MPQLAGCQTINHFLPAPLDYNNPKGDQITLFARELRAPGHTDQSPILVFLQGGPGYGAPRPFGDSGWIGEALNSFRVLLLDQRGTGLSTPIDRETLHPFSTAQEQADYLACFRADNIVRDCELFRTELLSASRPWSVLGQSFGGFCVFTYLSMFPDSLASAMVTGGIPGLTAKAEDVYRHTYPRVLLANQRYFAKYPQDQDKLALLAQQLNDQPMQMPGGDYLTVERLQQLGLALGASDGDELIHYLVEELVDGKPKRPGYRFLHGLERLTDFNTNPIFTILHEACYAQGEATRWAAHRVRSEFEMFNWKPGMEFLFTGEMLYPWMLDQYRELQPFAKAGQLLAEKGDWPQLYNVEQLQNNRVPTAAAVYYDDMYVDRVLSMQTAAITSNLQCWVTNEYQHNGLRADGAAVFGRLFGMLEGRVV